MGVLVILLLIVGILIASVAERRRMWHRRRLRSRLRGFVRRPGGWEEWDQGL